MYICYRGSMKKIQYFDLRSFVRSGEVHKRKKSLMRQGTSRWTDSPINNSTDV